MPLGKDFVPLRTPTETLWYRNGTSETGPIRATMSLFSVAEWVVIAILNAVGLTVAGSAEVVRKKFASQAQLGLKVRAGAAPGSASWPRRLSRLVRR